MSATKQWPELVGQTFEQASQAIRAYDASMYTNFIFNFTFLSNDYFLFSALNPYNARNGIQNRMFDPKRVVCVTNDSGVVTAPPHYTSRE